MSRSFNMTIFAHSLANADIVLRLLLKRQQHLVLAEEFTEAEFTTMSQEGTVLRFVVDLDLGRVACCLLEKG